MQYAVWRMDSILNRRRPQHVFEINLNKYVRAVFFNRIKTDFWGVSNPKQVLILKVSKHNVLYARVGQEHTDTYTHTFKPTFKGFRGPQNGFS